MPLTFQIYQLKDSAKEITLGLTQNLGEIHKMGSHPYHSCAHLNTLIHHSTICYTFNSLSLFLSLSLPLSLSLFSLCTHMKITLLT